MLPSSIFIPKSMKLKLTKSLRIFIGNCKKLKHDLTDLFKIFNHNEQCQDKVNLPPINESAHKYNQTHSMRSLNLKTTEKDC